MKKKKLDIQISEIGPKADELKLTTSSPGGPCSPCAEMGDLADYMPGYAGGQHSETYVVGELELDLYGKPVIEGSCLLGIITDVGNVMGGE
jgi:hypothetical protein